MAQDDLATVPPHLAGANAVRAPGDAGGSALRKAAGAAAIFVALGSITFGLIYTFLVPLAQKNAPPGSLISYQHDPVPRLVAEIGLGLVGLALSVAVVGIYDRVRVIHSGWAIWSLILGAAYSLLTSLSAVYIAFVMVALGRLYERGNAAVRAAAVVAASLPSPLDPYDFAKLVLGGLWLMVTGLLMVHSRYFPRLLGFLAFYAGFGVLTLFISIVAERPPRSIWTQVIITILAEPGALLFSPLFFLWTGYVLWTKDA